MLLAAQFAVGIGGGLGEIGGDQPGRARALQQRDVADVVGQLGMMWTFAQHQILHAELDVDDAAAVVFEVK